MRRALGLVVGALVAVLGGLVLGEYELSFDGFPRPGGWMPVVAGALFGLAVVEAVVWAAGEEGGGLVGAAGGFAAAAMLWAGWIFVRHRDELVPVGNWVAAAAAVLVAVYRLRPRSVGRRGSDSRPEP